MAAALMTAAPWLVPGAFGGLLAATGYSIQRARLARRAPNDAASADADAPAEAEGSKTDARVVTGPLDPKPDAFDMDEQATRIFKAAAAYKHLAPAAYEEALLSTDSLLFLERGLATGASRGQLEDMPDAQNHAATALEQFERLWKSARTGQSVVELEQLHGDHRELIRHHLKNVELLLENVQL
jgi:hypothetical protein